MGERSKPDRRSAISILLLGAFALLLLIMTVIWYANVRQLGSLYTTIERSRIASDKMDLIALLIEVSRDRTRLTNQMLFTEDRFERDELNMQLEAKAGEFADLRQRLIDTGLSEEEHAILYLQAVAIRYTLRKQREAAEMAQSYDSAALEEARRMVVFEIYPGQGEIIDAFMQLLKLQKHHIDEAADNARIDYERSRRLQTLLFVGVLALSLLIMAYVTRRIVRTERALFLAKERAQITLRSIGDAVISTDRQGRVEYMNPVAERLTGCQFHQCQGVEIGEIFVAYDEGRERPVTQDIAELLAGSREVLPSNDILLRSTDGQQYNIAITIAPIQDQNGAVQGSITTFQDITESRQLARKIEFQAKHDALTGLLNRREFETKVRHMLTVFERDTAHALGIIDLDRFKVINDTCGHAAGDELLRQLTQLLKHAVRRSDLLARVGGDEFAIFLTNIDTAGAEQLANRMLQAVREFRFLWEGKSFTVGACIGLVDAPPELADYSYLYHAADTACFMAKHEGRDRVRVLSLDDVALTEKRKETEWLSKVQEALEQDGFTLFSQPIVPLNSATRGREHREVLLRLRNEDGSYASPMCFIPTAERYNLMPRVDLWVTRRIVEYIRAHLQEQRVYAVNLSGQTIGDHEQMQQILTLVQESGVEPWRLCFEITETATIANLESARALMQSLRRLGCGVALDDFGSGLSSFAYLKNLPIDFIKIDGMFIRQIVTERASRIMVDAIHSVGKKMGLTTVAEYVETREIAEAVRKIGVDFGQGYYFAEPTFLI